MPKESAQRRLHAVRSQDVTPQCEWWDYGDGDVEGGVLEFSTRLELHVYKRRGEDAPVALWLSDDERYVCIVELARA